jgi:hypothetical protein
MTEADALVTGLAQTPDALEGVIRLFPAARLTWRPESWGGSPGEPFSPIEHVCHLRDIERDGYHVRIRRLLTEENPSLASIDGNALALERRYTEASVADALLAFRDARRQTLETIGGLGDAELDRRGEFAEYGALTLRGLLHYLCSHDQQHLACLHWLFGKASSAGLPYNSAGREP